jgi:hypothetical protein
MNLSDKLCFFDDVSIFIFWNVLIDLSNLMFNRTNNFYFY